MLVFMKKSAQTWGSILRGIGAVLDHTVLPCGTIAKESAAFQILRAHLLDDQASSSLSNSDGAANESKHIQHPKQQDQRQDNQGNLSNLHRQRQQRDDPIDDSNDDKRNEE